VLDGLRNAILGFELKPGQRLVERELIEQIGVSRATVREVLRELAAEGLVVSLPNKGAVVYAPSAEEARDLYAVRSALEGLVVRRFVERAEPEQFDHLKAVTDELNDTVNHGAALPELMRAKDRFYQVLAQGAGSPTVDRILGGVQARVRLLQANSLAQPGRAARMAAEVDALVEAILARDADKATRLWSEHLDGAADSALTAARVV
jgi:DNA-binding GntR family transcriptional regulator